MRGQPHARASPRRVKRCARGDYRKETVMATFHPIFLRDGGQHARVTADALARFLRSAKKSLSIAIYNVAHDASVARALVNVLRERVRDGVSVRIAYDENEPDGPIKRGDPRAQTSRRALRRWFRGSGVELRAVRGSALMHHKYVVRDAGTSRGAVWTGSTNFSAD